jgi:membrane protease YdiL (CAAX protease family)
VFGIFFVVMLVLVAPLARLPVIYAILLQGLFNLALVGFIAAWVRIVRRRSFTEYIHFLRSRTFSTRSLIILGASSALSVLFVSAFLPTTGQTPLEKLLTSREAILVFAIFGVAVAPMLEEIIFRGFLFKALWEIGGTRIAIPVTAALFALLHAGQLAGNWGGVALIFVVGCILSVVRHRSNSIIPTFVVHTSYNATLFVLFALSSIFQKLPK